MNGYKARFARASMMPSRNGRPSTIDCLNHNSNLNLTVQFNRVVDLVSWCPGRSVLVVPAPIVRHLHWLVHLELRRW